MKTPYWIWQYAERSHFCWNNDSIIASLARVREKQGRLLGLMDGLGFDVQSVSSLEVMTEDELLVDFLYLCRFFCPQKKGQKKSDPIINVVYNNVNYNE